MKLHDESDPKAAPSGSKTDATRAADTALQPVSFVPRQVLVDGARRLQRARDVHAKHFPKEVFRDTAWDILLELFIATEESRETCVKDAMLVAGESSAGVVRRIDGLERAGLIHRDQDPTDHRRILLHLSEKGAKAMLALLREMFAPQSIGEWSSVKEPISFSPYGRK